MKTIYTIPIIILILIFSFVFLQYQDIQEKRYKLEKKIQTITDRANQDRQNLNLAKAMYVTQIKEFLQRNYKLQNSTEKILNELATNPLKTQSDFNDWLKDQNFINNFVAEILIEQLKTTEHKKTTKPTMTSLVNIREIELIDRKIEDARLKYESNLSEIRKNLEEYKKLKWTTTKTFEELPSTLYKFN